MGEAYIVGAVRTACGRRNGRLSGVHPIDLGAAVVDELLDRSFLAGHPFWCAGGYVWHTGSDYLWRR